MGFEDMEAPLNAEGHEHLHIGDQAADFPTIEVVDQSAIPHHPGADPDAAEPERELQDQHA